MGAEIPQKSHSLLTASWFDIFSWIISVKNDRNAGRAKGDTKRQVLEHTETYS